MGYGALDSVWTFVIYRYIVTSPQGVMPCFVGRYWWVKRLHKRIDWETLGVQRWKKVGSFYMPKGKVCDHRSTWGWWGWWDIWGLPKGKTWNLTRYDEMMGWWKGGRVWEGGVWYSPQNGIKLGDMARSWKTLLLLPRDPQISTFYEIQGSHRISSCTIEWDLSIWLFSTTFATKDYKQRLKISPLSKAMVGVRFQGVMKW